MCDARDRIGRLLPSSRRLSLNFTKILARLSQFLTMSGVMVL